MPKSSRVDLLSGGEGMTSKWVVENQRGAPVTLQDNGVVDVVASGGITMWYDKKFKGEYQISYSVKFVMEGGPHDRLSDLNCFWGAVDPKYPKDFWKQSEFREGDFANYSPLDLFYVGYGGNRNRTTRFRRYDGKWDGIDREKNRAVINEYLDPADLLKLGEWMNVVITVKDGHTTYSMNGKQLVNHPLAEGQDEGYFGIRLVRNHILLTNFKVKVFTKADVNKYDEVIVEREAQEIIADKWGDKFKSVEYPKQYLKNVVEVAPSESIQAAIDAVSSKGGGVVKLMAGEHVVTECIMLKSGVTIIGEGADKTVVSEGEGIDDACFMAGVKQPIEDVVMKDFTIKGNNLGKVQGIYITGVNEHRHSRIMFQDLVVVGWGSQGVHIKRANHLIFDRCKFNGNGILNGLYHNLYFLYNTYILQSDCDFSYPVKGKGAKYTSCEHVLAQRVVIKDCIGNGVQADHEQTGYLFFHKYKISGCGQVALWFPCENYYGKFDYTEDPKFAPQNVILSRCKIVDNTWGAMWRVVGGESWVINSYFANKKIDMGLLLCNVTLESSLFDKGNKIYTDLKQWPLDVHLLW